MIGQVNKDEVKMEEQEVKLDDVKRKRVTEETDETVEKKKAKKEKKEKKEKKDKKVKKEKA